jgi:hypothetical protein
MRIGFSVARLRRGSIAAAGPLRIRTRRLIDIGMTLSSCWQAREWSGIAG